jgi:hypothetical protein
MRKIKHIYDSMSPKDDADYWRRTSPKKRYRTGADYKTVGNKDLVMVAGFPGYEALWIEMLGDDLDNGVGFIDSFPEKSSLRYGQLIRYENGSAKQLPVYAGKVDHR